MEIENKLVAVYVSMIFITINNDEKIETGLRLKTYRMITKHRHGYS
jgi:hypothetical protein